MSDPLSKIYCVYCEHLWRDSMFDSTRFNSRSGLVRMCDLTDSGFVAIAALVTAPLDRHSTTPLLCVFYRRYADDSRSVAYYDARSPTAALVAKALSSLYKTDCYIKPCVLEDEEEGASFLFLQGHFSFGARGCSSSYVHKNGASLLAGAPRTFRTLQHFWSYGQSNRALRLATVCGKLCEVRCFCSDLYSRLGAILSLCVEFKSLEFPVSVIASALHRQFSTTSDVFWSRLASVIHRIYRLL
jgi:hypothetical protein